MSKTITHVQRRAWDTEEWEDVMVTSRAVMAFKWLRNPTNRERGYDYQIVNHEGEEDGSTGQHETAAEA